MKTKRVSDAIELERLCFAGEGDTVTLRSRLRSLWDLMSVDEKDYFAAYVECIENGCNDKLADMLASQQGPGLLTDTVFMSDRWDGGITDLKTRVEYKKIAEKAGVNAEGKQYIGGLARFPGDPSAWVDNTAQVKQTCEERDWNCEGAVSVHSSVEKRVPRKIAGNIADRFRKAGLPVAA